MQAKPIFADDPPPASKPLVITRVVPRAAATVSPPTSIDNPAPRAIAKVAPKAVSMDDALLAILDRPLHGGETVAVGYARKEAELAGVLARLSVPEARALHLRLTVGAANDALATKFARLTIERRNRLLVFLADARRREALRGR